MRCRLQHQWPLSSLGAWVDDGVEGKINFSFWSESDLDPDPHDYVIRLVSMLIKTQLVNNVG